MNKEQDSYDVIAVGAGIGGLYAVHRFRQQGLSVLCLESAAGIGGVWYHNRYPGARVDIDSVDYCYYFSSELFRDWRWSERYAAQPELLAYLNHVADRFDLRRHIQLNTRVTSAQWHHDEKRYEVGTQDGRRFFCRYLVMTTGQLSAARDPEFPGLKDFKGEWVQASHWPDRPVQIAGRRVAVIGTGSSGVQAIPVIAETAKHLYVFQRSPNFVVPAQNGPLDEAQWKKIGANVPAEREHVFGTPGANHRLRGPRPAAEWTPEQRQELLEAQWAHGGQGMNAVFSDQAINKEANDYVADFVRSKIRQRVKDPAVAELLCPYDHPIGTRRLCLDTNYYEAYNRDNVTLVNLRGNAIERITPTGIQTADGKHYEVDLIVFALGFHAFTGALRDANIRNERGETVVDLWKRGPQTLLGIMTKGFPNLFTITGAGSTSVLATMTLVNEFHIDWVAECIAHMQRHGYATVEPKLEDQNRWTEHVADVASKILRRNVRNYMVHVNDDGSRVFMPYVGGFDKYVKAVREHTADNYRGFSFK